MGVRMRASRPAFVDPSAATHWTCWAATHPDTHHLRQDRGGTQRCIHCGTSDAELHEQQHALLRLVTSVDGRKLRVWQITAWAPEPGELLNVYRELEIDQKGGVVNYDHLVVRKGDLLEVIRRAGLHLTTD